MTEFKNLPVRRIAALVLAVQLAVGIVIPFPVTAEPETVSVSTAEDLKKLAENCAYDAFSKNKQVVLLNDIDCDGEEIKPIPVFCGIFEGNNHTIRNFKLEDKGSEKGFFIRVAEDGTVRNLNLSGTVSVKDTKRSAMNVKDTLANLKKSFGLKTDDDTERAKIAGGVVASNYGTIQNCSFSGSISGEVKVGGIAGENRSTGVVDYCLNTAEVSGDQTTGGIVGSNQGRIESSKNQGTVNKNADVSSVNTGGVSGENLGLIRGCSNSGEIGCLHIGNNVGGIVGRQKGRISACSNYGKVMGRKCVGGIAGRFEPYTDIDLSREGIRDLVETGAESIRAEIEDTKEKAGAYADAVVDDVDRVAGKAAGVLDDLHRATGGIADTVSGLRTGGGELKDGLLDTVDSLNRLTDRLGGEGLDSLGDALDTFENSAENLNNMLDGLGAAAGEIGDAADGIDALADELTTAVREGRKDIRQDMEDLQSRLDDLDRLESDYLIPFQDNLEETHEELQRVLRAIRRSAGDLSDAISDPLERIDIFLEKVFDRVEDLRERIEKIRERVKKLLEEIKEHLKPKPTDSVLGKIRDRIFPVVYAEEEDKAVVTIEAPLYRDVAGERVDMAVIDQCYNGGKLEGSSAVGGIAGNVGVESSVVEGENAQVTDNALVDLKGYVKASIRSCITEQEVVAKDGYAGGIVGKAELGFICASMGTGDVTVTEGEYAGGIAGSTSGDIQRCIAIADLEGKNYLGGIAGKGRNVSYCYSLPRYEEGAEHCGAVAGTITGKAVLNYFIQEGLTGVDGADFQGAAVAVPPSEMVGTGGLPAAFSGFSEADWVMGTDDIYLPQIRELAEAENGHNSGLLRGKSGDFARFHFRVVFYQEDTALAEYTVDYGTILPPEKIPAAEPRDGFYPQWDQDVHQPIVRNTDFRALYRDATTTIATGENPPLLLVEGNFTEKTTLTAQALEWDEDFGYRCKRLAAYSFSILPEYSGKLRVHVRDESGKGNVIGIVSGGSKKLISCQRDGNYLIFELDAEQDFLVFHQGHSVWYWLGLSGLGIFLILGGILVLRIWRKRHPGKKMKKKERKLKETVEGETKTEEEEIRELPAPPAEAEREKLPK